MNRRQKEPVNSRIAFVLLATALTGCQSGTFSHYISPQVTGRVLAADTGQPLAGVMVRRVAPVPISGEDTPPKPSQLLIQPAARQTDENGRFILESERVISPFRHGGWHSVTVSFEDSGYQRLQTNFTSARFNERSPDGEPLVKAGDIRLQPVPR
jgi:hypothetical protein